MTGDQANTAPSTTAASTTAELTTAPLTTAPLTGEQRSAWQSALALWGVRMHDAVSQPDAHERSFAWFSFPPTVHVDPAQAVRVGVAGEWETIFAHELGHHVLSPSTRITSLKLTHQMGRALTASSPDAIQNISERASWLSNVWSDMLINVRVAELQRRRNPVPEPGMVRIWRILTNTATPDPGWWVVTRAYEELWSLPPGTLAAPEPPEGMERTATKHLEDKSEYANLLKEFTGLIATNPRIDAGLLADTVRTFGADPIRGALRFGMILAPYLLAQEVPLDRASSSKRDVTTAGVPCGGEIDAPPATAEELGQVLRDDRLRERPRHPLDASAPESNDTDQAPAPDTAASGNTGGQGYGLSETRALYSSSDHAAVLQAWYLAEASRWVRPYRQPAVGSQTTGMIPGPLDVWSIDDELTKLDWPATLAIAPEPIPGVTTRLRTSFEDETPRSTQPVTLDLYIDSSGSMPSPDGPSPAVLAGAILLLSVLRGGGRVRVTSFASAGDVAGYEHFGRDRTAALSILTTFFGSGTVFPLDLLGTRYSSNARAQQGHAHLVVLSDDGLQSMFGEGQEQFSSVARQARSQLDSATLIVLDPRQSMATVAATNGYSIDYLDSMDDAPAVCARLAIELASFGRGVHHG
jgi:hypothetical protein